MAFYRVTVRDWWHGGWRDWLLCEKCTRAVLDWGSPRREPTPVAEGQRCCEDCGCTPAAERLQQAALL